MSARTWPLRSYPNDCISNEAHEKIGPAAAKHLINFRSLDHGKRYAKDRSWRTFKTKYEYDGIELEEGNELLITMELDWREGSTKDMSLVFWGTGQEKLEIELLDEETKSSSLPLTTR